MSAGRVIEDLGVVPGIVVSYVLLDEFSQPFLVALVAGSVVFWLWTFGVRRIFAVLKARQTDQSNRHQEVKE